jgi:hydroxymethylglutaryl-CoA lyase
MKKYPDQINIYEVGPRDGLQDIKTPIPVKSKYEYIQLLAEAGCQDIETTAFVNPKKIPQMADASELVTLMAHSPLQSQFSILVPNKKGLQNALNAGMLQAGIKCVAVFTAACEEFSQANIGTSIKESMYRFAELLPLVLENDLSMRGYISTSFFDPYRKQVIDPNKVVAVSEDLFHIGVDEVCLADTTGDATPESVEMVLTKIKDCSETFEIALHFHDKNGLAIANIERSIELGFTSFDSASGGLGGCPSAPEGAPGNVSTEALVAFANQCGIETGINLEKLSRATRFIKNFI